MQYTTDRENWRIKRVPKGTSRTKISGLVAGTEYWVRVRAIIKDNPDPGPWSYIKNTVVTDTFGVPDFPTGITLTPRNQRLTVTWTPPTDDGGSDIVGYDITHTNDKGDFIRNKVCKPRDQPNDCITGTVIDITGLTNGVSYEVTVRACNLAGCGQYPTSVSGTPNQ